MSDKVALQAKAVRNGHAVASLLNEWSWFCLRTGFYLRGKFITPQKEQGSAIYL